MELDQFISGALLGIAQGIRRANADLRAEREPKESVRSAFFTMGPVSQNEKQSSVEFDVAVTSQSVTEGSGKAGGMIIHVVELGGELRAEQRHEQASRMKFTVWVLGQLI